MSREPGRMPDFLIVGGPKCGTTALYYYLKQHPQIFMPNVKEVHYFGSDLHFKLGESRLDADSYMALFSRAKPGQCLGEASVWYLYSNLAAQEIADRCPAVRIIIMLRNPVDVLHSLHSQFVFEGNEDILDFEQALEAEADRVRGLRVPPSAYFVEGLFYRRVVGFSSQVDEYLRVFGHERVLFVIYDDFKRDTYGAYREVTRFLGVRDDFRPTFRIINANKQVRSRYLQQLMLHPPEFARRIYRLLRFPRAWRKFFYDQTRNLNTRVLQREPMRPEFRGRLKQELREEVERLSELLGKDLGSWLR